MDQFDQAQALEQEMTARYIEAQRAKVVTVLPFCGACYNCEHTIDAGEFCDADCRDDWELRKRMGAQRA